MSTPMRRDTGRLVDRQCQPRTDSQRQSTRVRRTLDELDPRRVRRKPHILSESMPEKTESKPKITNSELFHRGNVTVCNFGLHGASFLTCTGTVMSLDQKKRQGDQLTWPAIAKRRRGSREISFSACEPEPGDVNGHEREHIKPGMAKKPPDANFQMNRPLVKKTNSELFHRGNVS